MKINIPIASLMMTAISISSYSYYSESYTSTDQYSIQFSTKKADGNLYGLKGIVSVDKSNLIDAKISVVADVNTIKTGNDRKDKHAKGKKWFDAETYPNIKFEALRVEKINEQHQVTGKLTIKDVTKEVIIPFNFTNKDNQEYLEGTLSLNREEYNINGNFFGFAVGKDIEVNLSIPNQFKSS